MSLSLLLQYCVIALAVLASAGVVMRRQFPNATRSLRIACALPLLREGRPRWMRVLGKGIAPAAASKAGACGGCDGCGPTP
jgi:hypothetical protein